MNNVLSIITFPFRQGYLNILIGCQQKSELYTRISKIVIGCLQISAIPLFLSATAYLLKNRKVQVIPPPPITPRAASKPNQSLEPENSDPVQQTVKKVPTPNVNSSAINMTEVIIPKIPVDPPAPHSNPPINDHSTSQAPTEASQEGKDEKETKDEVSSGSTADDPEFDFNDDDCVVINNSNNTGDGGLKIGTIENKRRLKVDDDPTEETRKSPSFMVLLEQASKLKTHKSLTKSQYAAARLAQINAGNMLLKFLDHQKLIIGNAEEYQHIPSMLNIAKFYFSIFKNPFGKTCESRSIVSEEVLMTYLEKSRHWFEKACGQIKEDKKLYRGKALISLRAALKKYEEQLKAIKEHMDILKKRMEIFQKGKDALTCAWVVAQYLPSIECCKCIQVLADRKNIKPIEAMLNLYAHVSKKKDAESLKLLWYFKVIAWECHQEKLQEAKRAKGELESLLESHKQINKENTDMVINSVDMSLYSDDIFKKTRDELKTFEEMYMFIIKKSIPDDQPRQKVDTLILQSIHHFRCSANMGSRVALNSLMKLGRTSHPAQSLSIEQLYELGVGLPKEIDKQISLNAISELINCIDVETDNADLVWSYIERVINETQDLGKLQRSIDKLLLMSMKYKNAKSLLLHSFEKLKLMAPDNQEADSLLKSSKEKLQSMTNKNPREKLLL